MTRRRRAANPFLAKPLTKKEGKGYVTDGSPGVSWRDKGNPINCSVCHKPGGTLVKVEKNKYRHNDCYK